MSIRRLLEILLHFIFPVSCSVCGKPGTKLCPECAKNTPYLEEIFGLMTREVHGLTVYSIADYTDIKEVIWRFKYDGERELCSSLGRKMAELFGECRADYLIPVPLHLNSERGYNQSLELARGMCEVWQGTEIIDGALWTREVPRRALSKTRDDLTWEDFRLTRDIYGKRVALVDDVCTSGHTLSCLAETCRREGAIVICAYTLASTSL